MSLKQSSSHQGPVEAPDMVRFRILIMKKGKTINNMKELQRVFKKGDLAGTGELSTFEFKALVHLLERLADENGYGPFYPHTKFTDNELDKLFTTMESSGNMKISFSTFFNVIRGPNPLSPRRAKLVKFAFNQLDVRNKEAIGPEELQKYTASKLYNQLLALEKSETQILTDIFSEVIKRGEGQITRAAFENYYSTISVFIESDKQFAEIVYKDWKFTAADIAKFESWAVTNEGGLQTISETSTAIVNNGAGGGEPNATSSGSVGAAGAGGLTMHLPVLVGSAGSGKQTAVLPPSGVGGSRATTPPGDDGSRPRARTPMSSERNRAAANSRRQKTLSYNPPDMRGSGNGDESPKEANIHHFLGSTPGATPMRSLNSMSSPMNSSPTRGTPMSPSPSMMSGTMVKVSLQPPQPQQPKNPGGGVGVVSPILRSTDETPKKGMGTGPDSASSSIAPPPSSRHEKLRRALSLAASPSQLSAATTAEESSDSRSRGASLSSVSSGPTPTQSNVPHAQLEALLASLPPESKATVLELCEEAEELRMKLQEAQQYKTQMDTTAADNRALRAKNYELSGQKESLEKRLAAITKSRQADLQEDAASTGGSSLRLRVGAGGAGAGRGSENDAVRMEEVIEAQRKTISSQETTIRLYEKLMAER